MLHSFTFDSRLHLVGLGLLPIYQWLTSLERMHPPTRKLLTIERLQGWSMIAYYPLEHLYYLRAHAILPAALALPLFKKSISLNTGKISLWSTRFWAAYVFLQFAHLREDHHLLKLRERALNKVKGKGKASDEAAEKADLTRRWDALINELVVNLGYLPLTLHWCVLNLSLVFPASRLCLRLLLISSSYLSPAHHASIPSKSPSHFLIHLPRCCIILNVPRNLLLSFQV